MKKLTFCVLLLLALCTLLFAGCGDTPPEEQTLDEQISVGMTYNEVAELAGTDGVVSELFSNIYIWDTGDDKDLYVWFSRETYEHSAAVTKFERRDDLTPEIGMTRAEVDLLFGETGKVHDVAFNIYRWKATDKKSLYGWFDADNKLLRYELAEECKLAVGMSQEQVVEFFLTDGSAVDDVYGLYRWRTFIADEFMYVRFDEGVATKVFMDKDVSVQLGDSYERLSDIYGTEGTKVGRWDNIYSWQTSSDSFGLFKFADDNGTLKLLQFVPSMADISVGMTFSELNELLGTVGVDAGITTTTVYKWDTELEENLYIWFDSELIATKFCFAKDGDVELKAGVPYVDVLYILDAPYDFSYRWITTEETDICIRFVQDESTEQKVLEEIFRIPKLDVYKGMTREYVVELMGKEAEWSFGSGNIWYVWPIEDSGVWLCVAFNDNGAYSINFSKANSVVFPVSPAI